MTAHDDPAFADLFDELLQQLIDGNEPDLSSIKAERPELAARVDEAMAMACAVAGRRQPVAPTLAGYQVIRELGRGGMGTVYLARHEMLGREVALKVLPASMGLSPRSRARFHEEARALGRLQHDHIVRIHRVVEHGDMLAFEMEYVDGPSLRQVIDHLRGFGPGADLDDLARLLGVPTSQLGAQTLVKYFVRMGVQIARALHAAHSTGVVHRDVKPANLLIRRDGRPMLADFGLARGTDQGLTHSGTFAGTPTYASPEQLRAGDEAIDGRADVYSLGVTLYEAIALAPPFSGRSSTEMLRHIEEGRAVPLRSRAPRVSRDIETVLQKAMERLPKDRYASAAELADDLERVLELQPIRARRAGLFRRTWKFARRHRRPLLAAGAGALLVSAALLPVYQQVQAAESTRLENARLVAKARVQLLSAGGRLHEWRPYVLAQGGKPRQVAARDPMLDALEQARADYAAAQHNGLVDPDVQLESSVLAAMLWLRTGVPARREQVTTALLSAEVKALFTALPPLTRQAAERLAAGEELAPVLEAVGRSAPADRMALGLLCFLAGHYGVSERSWTDLDPTAPSEALRDTGLGMLYLGDGRTARAYVRLYQGSRAFPQSNDLNLLLASASLAMHDPGLARHWLDRVQVPAPSRMAELQLALLRADLQALEGDVAAARTGYEQLCAADPTDPMPHFRLAQSYAAAGEPLRAREQLQVLLADWPDVARLRLALAQVALQLEDAPLYLEQARYVLQVGIGADRSAGEAADLLEVLHTGGLDRLHREHLAGSVRTTAPPDAFALRRPVASLLPRWLRPQLEEVLERTARIGNDLATVNRVARGNLVRWCWQAAAVQRHVPALLTLLPGRLAAAWPLVPPLLGGELGYGIENFFHHFRHRAMQAAGLGPRLQALRIGDADGNLVFAQGFDTAGDVDGDGYGDYVLGCPPRVTADSAGKVEVLSGREGRVLATFVSPDRDRLFGFALARAGDVDGDGKTDWLVGGPLGNADARKPGAAWLLAHDGHVLRVITGDNPGFGVSVTGIGDWNGDSVDDVVIGVAPELRSSAALGEARVHSGRDGALLATFKSDRPGVWFGAAVANAGDVDGDGRNDLAVGGNFGGAPGLVRVFASGTGKVLHTWLDESVTTTFGAVIIAAGDLDGDGHGDVAVAAPGDPTRPGRVLVFSGKDGTVLRTLQGDVAGDHFGQSMATTADVDGDGTGELLVGAAKGGSANSGYLKLASGRSGQWLFSWSNLTSDSAFASHLACTRIPDQAALRIGIANASSRGLGSLVVLDLPVTPRRQ